MSILDLFRKKEEKAETPDLIDEKIRQMDANVPPPEPYPQPEQHFQPESFPREPSFQQPQMSEDQQIQLISAKLDTIKAQLETVLQRLDRLEKGGDEHTYRERWRGM